MQRLIDLSLGGFVRAIALAIAAFAILEISSLDRAVHLYFELLTYCRSAAFVVAAAAVATIEARNALAQARRPRQRQTKSAPVAWRP